MKIGRAAAYFSSTPVDGWNGTSWDRGVTTVTLDPYDRFISERQFGLKRRMLLVQPDDIVFPEYSVIRLPSGEAYLVGAHNSDVRRGEYSKIYLVHRAQYFGTLYQFVKTVKASGMAGAATRSSIGNFWCDVERITMAHSKEFDGVDFSQMTLTLPRDCPADTDNELFAADRYHDIKEVSADSGFRVCRALAKRSS